MFHPAASWRSESPDAILCGVHCEASSFPTIFVATSVIGAFDVAMYVQLNLSFFPFNTFREKRTSGLAKANEKRSDLMACKIFTASFKAVCFLTGILVRKFWTLMDVPTG